MIIQLLPHEMKDEIVKRLENPLDLAHLRQTCKAFDTIAEKEMFTQKISLTSDTKIMQFNRHLAKKPEHKHTITHLCVFPGYSKTSEMAMLELLRLAFTPSMISFTGRQSHISFYTTMIDMKQSSSSKFEHLRVIPYTENNRALQAYWLTVDKFKETLRELQIKHSASTTFHMLQSVTRLDSFHCLTKLTISISVINLREFHGYLTQCPHLLELVMIIRNLNPESSEMARPQIRQWFASFMDKGSPSLRKLRFDAVGRCTVVLEYLMLMYPHVEEIIGHFHRRLDPLADGGYYSRSISSVIQAVEHIPRCAMEFTFDCCYTEAFEPVSVSLDYNPATHDFSYKYNNDRTMIYACFLSKQQYSNQPNANSHVAKHSHVD